MFVDRANKYLNTGFKMILAFILNTEAAAWSADV